MKIKNKITHIITALLFLSSMIVKAQVNDTLEIQRSEKGQISFARFKFDSNRKIQTGTVFLKNVLNTKTDDNFLLFKDTTDDLGMSHQTYQQYFSGVKVENAEYSVHGKNGIIEVINGDFQDVVIPTIIPSISEDVALASALDYVNAKRYKWQDLGMENFIKISTKNPTATYYPKAEKVITKDFLLGGNNFRLAWKFTISSLSPANEQLIYVDATTGVVIRNTPLVYDVNTPCNAQTRYSGLLGLTGDSFAGGFRLRETRNAVNVQTLNLQSTYNYAGAIDFANANTNFTNGNWPTFNQDRAALDAHWGAEMVLDYWRIIHNRNSIDGAGIRVLSYVHAGANWNNAQWVGGINNRFMQYGDGDGLLFTPLTALDICGHEMGHGITEFTAALVPGTQESGALNEGFSDIWGACVERRSAPTKLTWLIGEEIFAGAAFSCIRNMQNPNSNTTAEGQHPDTYLGNFWRADGESHNNSTVLSHWFFLLSQGGNGTNDIGNTFNVAAIGIDNAQLIAYRTLLLYLTSTANYTAARNGSIQAARDLYGVNSCQEIAVTDAWFAVGVGNAYSGNGGFSINGDGTVCTTSGVYLIPNLPVGATVQWTTTPVGFATPNTPTQRQTTLTKNSNGVITLIATITNACGTGGQIVITKPNIATGTGVNAITFNRCIINCDAGPYLYADIVPVPGATKCNWYYKDMSNASNPFVFLEDAMFGTDWPLGRGNRNYTIRAEVITLCGTLIGDRVVFAPSCTALLVAASPNPTTGDINLTFSEQTDTSLTANLGGHNLSPARSIQSIGKTIVSLLEFNTSLLVRQWVGNEMTSKTLNYKVAGLRKGLYILQVDRNNKTATTKIIIE